MFWNKIMICNINSKLFLWKNFDSARLKLIKLPSGNRCSPFQHKNWIKNIELTHFYSDGLNLMGAYFFIIWVEDQYFLIIILDLIFLLRLVLGLRLGEKHVERFSWIIVTSLEVFKRLIVALITDSVTSISQHLENSSSDIVKNNNFILIHF